MLTCPLCGARVESQWTPCEACNLSFVRQPLLDIELQKTAAGGLSASARKASTKHSNPSVPKVQSPWIHRAFKVGLVLGMATYIFMITFLFWAPTGKQKQMLLSWPWVIVLLLWSIGMPLLFAGILFGVTLIVEAVVSTIILLLDPETRRIARVARQMKKKPLMRVVEVSKPRKSESVSPASSEEKTA